MTILTSNPTTSRSTAATHEHPTNLAAWRAGKAARQPVTGRLHYAWVVAAVTFLALLVSAGVRAAPGVLIKPLEAEFGWDRASISLAISVSIIALGLGGPISGSLIDRFGPRRVTLGATGLIALGLVPLLMMRELWQFYLYWGIVVGVGTGGLANVLGAAVAHRWFQSHRGLVVGLLGAAVSAGQLVFIPAMMLLSSETGWRSAVLLLAGALLALLVPVALFLRDRPEDLGLQPLGSASSGQADAFEDTRTTPLAQAIRSRDFWLLTGSFFICGYTTNGLIGTHLIPHTVEHGFSEVVAASTVALMGAVNIVGTLVSGVLTDRFDNRKLLAIYYGFRALSIAALPFILDVPGLVFFAVVYGLDWAATVPPTTNLTARIFGRRSVGTLFGWIFFGHMLGAALAAYAGGFFREVMGDYHLVFISAALIGLMGVGLSLGMRPAAHARRTLARAA